VAPSEIVATRSGNDLVFLIAGTTDKMTIGYFFYSDNPANAYNAIQQVQFSDGSSWDVNALTAKVLAGTSGADNFTGTVNADTINGQAGADSLYGRDGNDILNGGDDNDLLYGENGADTLGGGDGNDALNGGEGDDILIGGIGKDTYTLTETTAANNTLRIAAGDSLVSSFDVVYGFKPGTGTVSTTGIDKLDLDGILIAASVTAADGIDSGIIRSHSIVNGLISFDDIDDYTTSLTLNTSDLANVYSYLQNNITAAGSTVAFTASGSTYVFQDDDVSDTLVQLTGITATSISTTGLAAGAVWIA